MSNLEKISFIVLLLFALFLAGLLVHNHKELMQPVAESVSPFVSDRVAQIRIVMKEDDWRQLKTNANAKPYFRADFWFDGEPYKNVAIRPKGMSSLMSAASGTDRLPLKIDFNFFNAVQTFRGIKKLALNNGFSDPTFIRETISYELFEQMGLPAPRRAFADVWVNNIHLGLYTIVEQVDKTFLRRNFVNPEGNLYKPEMPAAFLNWTKDDLDKQSANTSQPSGNKKPNNMSVNVGGSRLGDLVKILKREGATGSEMLPDDTSTSSPGGPFGGGFRDRGGFPGGPGGQFPGEPNGPFGGGFRDRGGFPGGPGGQFPGEPNGPFGGGFRDRGGFPGGPGGQFPGEPNGPFGGGFRGRGGFPGGPGGGPMGGMFGRGGNLVEQMGLKTNENNPDHSKLFHFLEVLNKCPDDSFPTEIEKVLDVDEFLRFLAVSVLIVHLDNYIGMGHNYYLYEDNGKFCVIPWDLNMAFGTFGARGGEGGSSANFYIDDPVSGAVAERPLVARLLAHKPYLDKYHQYLEQSLKGGFAEGVIEARIEELVKIVRPFVEADELKFFSTEEFEKGLDSGTASGGQGGFSPGRGPMQGGRGGGPGMNAPGLKSFIKERRLSVREQLDGKQPSQGQGGEQRRDSDMFNGFRGNF
jgi:spore coat protein CotH